MTTFSNLLFHLTVIVVIVTIHNLWILQKYNKKGDRRKSRKPIDFTDRRMT